MRKLPYLFLASFLLLGGCAGKIAAGLGVVENEVAGAIANIKAMNDITATAYKQAPCAMDVGAYYRVLTPDERRAVDLLCGGSGEKPVTVEDMLRARGLWELVLPQ